jgi:hypothetical protein
MQPKPAITFRANTETLDRQGHLVPNRTTLSGGETISEADEQKFNRTVAFVPGVNAGMNVTGYHHGEEFTLYGNNALYFKNLHCPGNADDLFVVVSTDWDDHG